MRRTGFYITFSDRQGAIVYSPEMARQVVTRTHGPGFAPGTVTRVERVITEWVGSHDDNTRAFSELSRADVPLADLSGDTLPAYLAE